MPAVSVLLPVRDAQAQVSTCLATLLNQTFRDFEILVIDDGSRDRTVDVVGHQAASDPRVKLLRNDARLGVGASLNRGVAAARGALVARAEVDAYYMADHLEHLVGWLDAHPLTAVVGSNGTLVAADGRPLHRLTPAVAPEEVRRALCDGGGIVPATIVARRQAVEAAGLYAIDARIESEVDRELVVRIAAHRRVENVAALGCYLLRPLSRARRRTPAARRVDTLARTLLFAPLATARPTRPVDDRRIFVMTAAYEDAALRARIAQWFAAAASPDRVTIGVCAVYRGASAAGWARIERRREQVRVVCAHVNEARGRSWTRHVAARLWQGEPFVLQIDRLTRCRRGWDDRLLEQLDACDAPRPILTERAGASRFADDGSLLAAALPPPRRGAPLRQTLTQGFLFADSRLLEDVPFDPEVYDENPGFTHAVRAWTAGWEFFALPGHREFSDRGERLRWWHAPRPQHPAARDRAGVGAYALGVRRSVADWERFAGVDLQQQTISSAARRGEPSPRVGERRSRSTAVGWRRGDARRSPTRAGRDG